ncbi:c-type cytochrome [Candidatus Halobeggiatoa sp. HSG11]|nr:c-type cytochrome [Candidatus Halobeggiatoa sp. HSG11]
MKNFVIISLLLINTVYAAGDAIAGKDKAIHCISCHSIDGDTKIPIYPKLAGQHEMYLIKAMKAYRDKTRDIPTMYTIAKKYFNDDNDIEDLAAHFAAQNSGSCIDTPQTTQKKVDEAKIIACEICHQPDGNSVLPFFPKLAGQNKEYLIRAMQAYKNGERQESQMSQMALLFGDDTNIENIAAYFAAQKPDTCE